MLGLIIAEKEETGNLIKTIKAKTIEFNGVRFYIGSVGDKQALICFCGIGKANAAAATMNMIINFNVDKIFNIGLCGSARPNIKPSTCLIANKVEYYDVDLTSIGYGLNQIPNEPLYFDIKDEYINKLNQIIEGAIIGTVSTGDSFVTINNVESFPTLINKDVIGIEMEAACIAQICSKAKVDFFCAKIVSDNLTFDESSNEQYKLSFKEMGKIIEKICIKVIETF